MCFNSSQVSYKLIYYKSNICSNYQFQFLIGKLQTSQGLFPLFLFFCQFQFLIGKLQTEIRSSIWRSICRFQFLIGKLQTIASSFLPSISATRFNSSQVSYKHKPTATARSNGFICFNSSQVSYKHAYSYVSCYLCNICFNSSQVSYKRGKNIWSRNRISRVSIPHR